MWYIFVRSLGHGGMLLWFLLLMFGRLLLSLWPPLRWANSKFNSSISEFLGLYLKFVCRSHSSNSSGWVILTLPIGGVVVATPTTGWVKKPLHECWLTQDYPLLITVELNCLSLITNSSNHWDNSSINSSNHWDNSSINSSITFDQLSIKKKRVV